MEMLFVGIANTKYIIISHYKKEHLLFIMFVLHHCVVIFFWSSGIMDCLQLSSAHALGGVSGVAPFITTEEQFQ